MNQLQTNLKLYPKKYQLNSIAESNQVGLSSSLKLSVEQTSKSLTILNQILKAKLSILRF